MPHFQEDPPSTAPPRRQARILAMQGLCQWEVQSDEPEQRFAEWLQSAEASPKVTDMAVKLIGMVWEETARWDALLGHASTHWDVSRISPVERNIMRVALAEWLNGITPPKVAMDEAIEVGREYGGADSPRFINGILDEIYRRETGDKGNT